VTAALTSLPASGCRSSTVLRARRAGR